MRERKLLNVEIDAELHKAIRRQALEMDLTIKDFVDQALREYLERNRKGAEGS